MMLNRREGIHLVPAVPAFTDAQRAFAREMEGWIVGALAVLPERPEILPDVVQVLEFLASAREAGLLPPLPSG